MTSPTSAANRAKRRQLREKAARAEAGPGEHIDRDAIYARDNGYCHLCKLPVARELATFDHVTPIALGGTDTEDNARTAHRACNSRKGHDPLVGPKPKPGIRRSRRLAAVARRTG